MMVRILMFGLTGQVAREVARRASRNVVVTALDRAAADLERPDDCARLITAADADVVLNAAAYTFVDRAETERERAYLVNGETPGAMARAAAKRNLPFLHVSTDYVFSGEGDAPWRESDVPAPVSVYGASKLAGEQAVTAAAGPYAVLRTSWVFSAHGSNFVKTMLRLGAEQREIAVVDDQRGGPTASADVADALLTIARAFAEGRGVSGIYHFAGAPPVSWREFAEAIFAGDAGPAIRPVPATEHPTVARRPSNSALDCTKIRATYGLAQPDWRPALRAVLDELGRRP